MSLLGVRYQMSLLKKVDKSSKNKILWVSNRKCKISGLILDRTMFRCQQKKCKLFSLFLALNWRLDVSHLTGGILFDLALKRNFSLTSRDTAPWLLQTVRSLDFGGIFFVIVKPPSLLTLISSRTHAKNGPKS